MKFSRHEFHVYSCLDKPTIVLAQDLLVLLWKVVLKKTAAFINVVASTLVPWIADCHQELIMVARSESAAAVAEFVTQDQLTALTGSLNDTMSELQQRFAEIDGKFNMVEQRVILMENVVQARLTDLEENSATLNQ